MVSHNEYSQNQYSTKYDRRFLFLMDSLQIFCLGSLEVKQWNSYEPR